MRVPRKRIGIAVVAAIALFFTVGAAMNRAQADNTSELCNSIYTAAGALHDLANQTDWPTYTSFTASQARSASNGDKRIENLMLAVAEAAWAGRNGNKSTLQAEIKKACISSF